MDKIPALLRQAHAQIIIIFACFRRFIPIAVVIALLLHPASAFRVPSRLPTRHAVYTIPSYSSGRWRWRQYRWSAAQSYQAIVRPVRVAAIRADSGASEGGREGTSSQGAQRAERMQLINNKSSHVRRCCQLPTTMKAPEDISLSTLPHGVARGRRNNCPSASNDLIYLSPSRPVVVVVVVATEIRPLSPITAAAAAQRGLAWLLWSSTRLERRTSRYIGSGAMNWAFITHGGCYGSGKRRNGDVMQSMPARTSTSHQE